MRTEPHYDVQAQDIDQEVKERAISCMGQIVAHLGDSLQQVSNEVATSGIYFTT